PDQEEVTVEVDAILNATGRMPNFDGLNLEATGLDMESLPAANDSMQSSVEHVFLAGDCSGHHQILHTANVEGAIAGRNAARVAQKLDGGPEGWPENYPDVEAVFTDPPFASVGHSIEPLRQAGVKFLHAEKHFSGQGRGIVMGAQHGFIRLLAEESGTLLGAQILGPRADDLIHVFSTAIGLGASAQDMERLPWYHPTLCEAILDVVRDVASQANSDR
ncbi:MAG: FAD-dependent oxidoreductase, partial [Planctomycetota bacterium]